MTSAITKLATAIADGTSSSIDFTNFSSAYDDLIIKVNARSLRNSGPIQDGLNIKFNSLGGTNYAYQNMYSDAGAAQGDAANNTNLIFAGYIPSSNATANIFSNAEIYISDYKDTTRNKTVKSNVVGENDGSQAYMTFSAGSFLNNSAITTISLLTGSGQNWASGSTAILYGVTKASSGGTGSKATGGVVTTSGGYTYHTFLSSGVFTPTTSITGAEVLVIAGGGSGGNNYSGGGGAGGHVLATNQSFSSGIKYAAIVGAGGSNASNGTNSKFASGTVALGGGYGGSGGSNQAGGSGGSGGGGGANSGVAGTGTVGQGNNGGAGSSGGNGERGGSGGGAGAAGVSGESAEGGRGTDAYSAWGAATSTGENIANQGYFYCGGGGAGSWNREVGPGGWGGGGGPTTGGTLFENGKPFTGGGGSGVSQGGRGGYGGSGVVIVRYTT